MNDEPLIDTRIYQTKTLRDEFAMAALPAVIVAKPDWMMGEHVTEAYTYADLMLEARK